MTFALFKNIIIEQNKVLLKQLSKASGLDEKMLLDKYMKPDYYLPVVLESEKTLTTTPPQKVFKTKLSNNPNDHNQPPT